MASLLLEQLASKAAVDDAVRGTKDRVLVLRFGRASDTVCLQQDDIVRSGWIYRTISSMSSVLTLCELAQLARCERELSKMARLCLVEVDQVPIYCQYFDIALIPATIFFVNGQHMKVDYGTPDHTKFIGAFRTKQDFIDLVEVRQAQL
ncbi:Thioredoxin-like protein 4B [Phytophthora pseudosyringae]|uniref:Thioredoxin-like protein 4B n=1 Tax=Phytophthora pseudosyringae TaxID=221518 RepID=A0A8T1WE73_9STRA|nr:Thioredoxin-like protein 4B [Phytophthora pseudosyringae]